MPRAPENSPTSLASRGRDAQYYRARFRHVLVQSLLLYLVPLALLVGYFLIESRNLAVEDRRSDLRSAAKNQAKTLNLFLRDRVTNLSNVVGNPELEYPPSDAATQECLAELKTSGRKFTELAFFDQEGRPLAYAGPFPDLETRDYSEEPWFQTLTRGDKPSIITDSYLGFREQPHFGIAVKRDFGDDVAIARAILLPATIQEYLSTDPDTRDTRTSVVDGEGRYQVTPPTGGELLGPSPFSPPADVPHGDAYTDQGGTEACYGFAWLKDTGWAVIVEEVCSEPPGQIPTPLLVLSFLFLAAGSLVLVYRARASVRHEQKIDRTEANLSGQLVQAAKLASVGELAAGIAHEINNPLAIIAEEVGLIKDLSQPEYADRMTPERLDRHLTNIHEATFRCRDITRKLLGFVRQDEVDLAEHDVHEILNDVVDGMLGAAVSVTNIEVVKDYCPDLPRITTDRGQLSQVFLNLVKNAMDAMGDTGKLILHTGHTEEAVTVTVSDTGCGMTPEQLERIFMPFYTTKEVGKGTGLGLSVSIGIVRSLGGNIYVESKPDLGSRFAVELPFEP